MQTKGEMLLTGIEKAREGLDMIAQLGGREDLLKAIVGTPALANKLRDVVKNNSLFKGLVLSMVSARNSRLSSGTVEGVINDFLDVLFDLSQPYRVDGASTEGDS